MEVCPLSRGVILLVVSAHGFVDRLNSYPAHYRQALAFSTILYPQAHQCSLRFAFLDRKTYGLTTFRASNRVG